MSKLDDARKAAEDVTAAFQRGDEGVTARDVAAAQDKVTIEAGRALVDDPFVPGQRVRASLSEVHPERRFVEAVQGAMKAAQQ